MLLEISVLENEGREIDLCANNARLAANSQR
jgi:hypothetical protein